MLVRLAIIFSIFISSIFVSSIATAEEIFVSRTEGLRDFYIIRQEGEKNYLDHFRKSKSGFQNLDQRIELPSAAYQGVLGQYLKQYLKISSRLEGVPLLSESPGQILWEAKNSWNLEWENKYREWIEGLDSTFFLQHGIATDCADVIYAFRWIFARINHLPAANRLIGTGDLFTHESVRREWFALPTSDIWYQDKRFIAALNYLLDNTYTHTLMRDSYPIAIRPGALAAGAFYLNLYSNESGHTQIVREFILDPAYFQPMQMLASSVPREVRQLTEYEFQGLGEEPTLDKVAFLRFLWPNKDGARWVLVQPEKMPFYSLEQFDPQFMGGYYDLALAVIHRMMPSWQPDYLKTMRSRVQLLMEKFFGRVKIVQDGFAYCSTHGPCREGGIDWENWSTPSRDRAIGNLVLTVSNLMTTDDCEIPCKLELSRRYNEEIIRVDGHQLTLKKAIKNWLEDRYSSDPNDLIVKRWGL